MGIKTIQALKGYESLLIIVPKEVSTELDIANQDWLQYEIRNQELVFKKLKTS